MVSLSDWSVLVLHLIPDSLCYITDSNGIEPDWQHLLFLFLISRMQGKSLYLQTNHKKEQSTTLETWKEKKRKRKIRVLCQVYEHFQYLLMSLEQFSVTTCGNTERKTTKQAPCHCHVVSVLSKPLSDRTVTWGCSWSPLNAFRTGVLGSIGPSRFSVQLNGPCTKQTYCLTLSQKI